VERIRDAIRLLAVVLTARVSRRPLRPLGDEDRRPLPGDELLPGAGSVARDHHPRSPGEHLALARADGL
jgi:hypothetical protein